MSYYQIEQQTEWHVNNLIRLDHDDFIREREFYLKHLAKLKHDREHPLLHGWVVNSCYIVEQMEREYIERGYETD